MSQSILPSLLGFSLGTYAILFSLITNRMKRTLRAVLNPNGVPYLDEINATFFHFIFVQVIGLLWSILYQSTLIWDIWVLFSPRFESSWFDHAAAFGGLVGFILLVYSIALTIASALAVYRLATIVDPGGD